MSTPFFRLIPGLALAALSLFGQSPVQFSGTPARVVGQPRLALSTSAPNLVEGREVYAPRGIAVDNSASPPVLYVADTGNSRILIWRNAGAASASRADGVIGQPDLYTTTTGGPSGSSGSSVGLRAPSGLAVDSRGYLYVYDTGNNRVLRYNRPYEHLTDVIQPDLVIGQTSFTAGSPNQGASAPTARSLASYVSGTAYTASLAIDSSDNLWVPDPTNRRVLRFPVSALGGSAANAPQADLVLGQTDFISAQALDFNTPANRLVKTALSIPTAVTFDPAGRVYIGDQASRVLAFSPPFVNGMAATRILGIFVNVSGQPVKPPVNQYTVGRPEGLFYTGNSLFVVDAAANRILRFPPLEQWSGETANEPSPVAAAVFGQNDFLGFQGNRGAVSPSESSFAEPTGVSLAGSELFLADTSNHRVLAIPVNGVSLSGASRVLGQINFNFRGVNLVEGRELFTNGGQINIPNSGNVVLGGGVVIDRNSNPPRLYIADTYNNRILGYGDARKVKPGDSADLVIGQDNLLSTLTNWPSGLADQPSPTGLSVPVGLAVDANGNLYVADRGNGRVLRFPKPFEQASKTAQPADLVIGQTNFTIKITDATRQGLGQPYGLALSADGHLLVSDILHHRVLLFVKPTGGDFSNGQQAATVIGQQNFTNSAASADPNRFNAPLHISTDTDDRLYVCDAGNRRVVIFDHITSAANNPAPAITLTSVTGSEQLQWVEGIFVSSKTGEIWVTDTGANRVVRYKKFDSLVLNPLADYAVPAVYPLAVTIDANENLVIADGANRIAFHFPGLVAVSAAHYLNRSLSPGMIGTMGPLGVAFTDKTTSFSTVPLPTELEDLQVLINDQPVPLYFVSPYQINFFVPMGVPTGTQTASLTVQKKSVEQILASTLVDIAVATPSFFTSTADGRGQIAALNQDNTINSASSPAARGEVIQLYATGQGFVPNAPPDGTPASGLISTPDKPRVFINTQEAEVQFSGLAPGFIGLWQINAKVPSDVPPSNAIPVVMQHRSIPSNQPASGGGIISTTICVK